MTLSTIPNDAIVTQGEAARILEVSRSTLARRIADGSIKTTNDGRILGATIVAYVGQELKTVRAGIVPQIRKSTAAKSRLRELATAK